MLHENITMGQELAFNKHFKFIFGSNVECHEDHKITNNMEEQTVSGIFPGPTANSYLSFRPFLSIKLFLYNSRIQRVSPLDCNTDNARIILTSIILKASKVAYIPNVIVYVYKFNL